MLTMLIGGLWHGAGWTFVVWGGIHGVGARGRALAHATGRGYVAPADTRRRRIVARLVTFHVVCLAWIFFRADSFGDRLGHARPGLFTGWGEASPLVTGGVLLAIAVGIGSQYLPARFPTRRDGALRRACRCSGQAVVLALALMLTNAMGPEGVAPFIYFQF